MLKSYIKRIFEVAKRGDAREESYYSCLEKLLKDYADSINKRNAHITTLPKKTEAGNPDFRVWDGKQEVTGYIEAKAPSFEDLDQIENTKQLKRYLHTFPNLILTNFLEFRLYRNGIMTDKILTARPYVLNRLKTIPPVEKETELFKLLNKFFSFSLPKVLDAGDLAVELAKRTSFLKDEVISLELTEETTKGKGNILGFYKAFKEHLISGITKEEFADIYSQTITYGLFAARTRTENGFNRKLAYDRIPKTIGILRDIFKFISLGDLPKQMEWIIDDISEVLAVADVKMLLNEYFLKHKGNDPVVHFYETFLSEYDPETREKRGVYYTPEPVVSYIVRSLHIILKERFNKKDGFASRSVTVLDPAAGTLTFPAEAARLAVEEFSSKYGKGAKEKFIKEHVLENFFAFELMMAPYAIGHLKMAFLLEEMGYKLNEDERFKLYLTNTLEMEDLALSTLPGVVSLSEESHLADEVKKETPVLVILGNPPYSGHSSNIGEWISKEIKAYFQVDGKPLGEKNPKWLQDDYVKFIRFAQWKIDRAGEGVLGFITNHSYLDNPTFRGMRQSLMSSFDEIYLLDLHGNSLKKEKCPDGSNDENVFDIQQGVAITLFIKKKGIKKRVAHSEIWGLRENKYNWLRKHDIKTTKWKMIKPKSEFYLFVPREEKLLKIYEKFPKITEIFPINSVGITTARDHFVIDHDKNRLLNRIRLFRNSKYSDDELLSFFRLNKSKGWNIRKAWNALQSISDSELKEFLQPVLYRPFDIQWIFYHDSLIERPRREVMRHMLKENLGLVITRQTGQSGLGPVFVSDTIIEARSIIFASSVSYLMPLYLYQEKNNPKRRSLSNIMMLFETDSNYGDKKPNLSSALTSNLAKEYKNTPSPEEIFFYIYAVLYSNIYREKYEEFLKIDFPRVPFTKNYKQFKKMGEYGEKLMNLHLLESPDLDPPSARFQGKGNNKVEKLRYEKGGLYINDDQYFEGISLDVWEYKIGGYQVCDKWLKERKGRILTVEEIKKCCEIVTALKKTIETQEKIDKIYPEIEKEIIDKP